MIMKNGKQIGFIYKNGKKIDKIIRHGKVYFEQGFTREKTSTTLPISFDGIGKDLKDYKIYGNTYQNNISGKNFADFSNCQGYNYTNGVPSTLASKITINSKDSNNINFTYTNNSFLGVVGNTMDLEPNTQYVVSFKREQNNNFSQRLHILNVSENNEYSLNEAINIDVFGNPYSHTFTTNSTGRTAIMISANNSSPSGETEAITEIMVRKDTTTEDYVPYVGGLTSPNPFFPQEIIECGDKTKNLLNKPATFTVERQTIDFSLQPGTYIVSCESPENYRRLLFFRWKENTDNGTYVYIEANTTSTEFTITKEISKLNFYSRDGAKSSTGNYTTYINLMIRKSTIDDDTYEPYGYRIPINIKSDNLFKAPETIPSSQRNLAIYTKINDNSFSLNHTQNVSTFTSPFVRIDFDITKFKPNTQYTVSKKHIVEGLNFNRNGSIRTYINGANGPVVNANSITFTTPNEITSLGIYFYLGYENTTKGESTITFYDIQLKEESTVSSQYTPYYNKTINIYLKEPLRKINEYNDSINFFDKKIIRRIGKNLPDINNISLKDNYANIEYAVISKPSDFEGYDKFGNYPMFCSHAVYSANPGNWNNIYNAGKLYTGAQALYWWIGFKKNTGLDIIKQNLKNCNIIYPLKTQTEENIELPNIPTIDGNNILNIETEITPSQVYIKYKSNN